MDVLAGLQFSPQYDFDQVVEIRAQKREHLRGRNNATSCRSPTRALDTWQIKCDLKRKRQLEFLRRRSVSPEPRGSASRRSAATSPEKTFSMKQNSSSVETLHSNVQTTLTAPSSSSWASLWTEQVTLMRQENGLIKRQASTSTPETKESAQHRSRNSINASKTSARTHVQAEGLHPKMSLRHETAPQRKPLREAGVQTESGLVAVKESDIKRLAEYLQDALWREEAMKKKLDALQESTSSLMNSSNVLWKARCSEDLLNNKIKALEAQLQVFLQKFPKDGVKKVMVQMETQKLIYEEKAVVALQKATQEKTEALSKAETLQEALITSKAEALRWQSLYEELRLGSGRLREQQRLSSEQLQQLHGQVELSRAREAELGDEAAALRRERQELQYNVCLLQEDNQALREEVQQLRDGGRGSRDVTMQGCVTSEEAEPQLTARRDAQVEEQLRHTEEKLRLKERECEELQSELHAMEQECQSSQARLSQCRDELRLLSHRRRRTAPCGSWWRVFLFFLVLLAAAGVVLLWLWHPPFREQLEDLYSDIETRIENYLMEMASPQHSGCFRPI